MIDIIKKAKNITRWSENLFTFVEIKDKNLYNMKNKNVKPIKGLIMKVNVSRKTKAVADEEKIAIGVLEEGVVHLYYYRGARDVTASTAKIVSLLKKDNPSLMVTALTVVVTSINNDGAIVNFEEKR